MLSFCFSLKLKLDGTTNDDFYVVISSQLDLDIIRTICPKFVFNFFDS